MDEIVLGREALENALRNLGATEKETEVYIFLTKRGAQKTGQIAKQLRTNKGLVYRILKSLQKKGLVESTLEYPTRFTVVPFEKLIDSFIESKREEVAQIEEAKKDLLSDWKKISQSELESSLEKFAIIEGNKKIHHKISQMVKGTSSQLSMALTVTDLFRAEQFGVFETLSKHPMKSKIQFQALTQLSKQNLKAVKILKPKLKPNLVFKGINPDLGLPPFSRMVIRDKEEIILFISEKVDQSSKEGKEVCLCTNCKSIVQAFSSVFEDLWHDSIDIEDLIIGIETGKSVPKTQLIKDPESAKKSYDEILNSANDEILIVTSSKGLVGLSKNKSQFEDWSKRGVTIRIMAPIVNENLDPAQELLKWSEVKHIPLGYFETTIVDEHHLFQFKPTVPPQKASHEKSYFENTYYTNDSDYVKKAKNMLYDIWRKTRTPSDVPLQSILLSDLSKKQLHRSLERLDRYSHKEREYISFGKITEKDVLEKIKKAKKKPSKDRSQSSWSDTLHFFGSRAFGLIRPPDYFGLPDLIIGIFHNIEASSFGVENNLRVFLMPEMTRNAPYQLVAVVLDNPKCIAYREALFKGMPAEKNIILVNKDQLNIKVQGNTLFAGWTLPIPLIPSKYILPPSCILFEGYGDVTSGVFNFINPSGRKQEVWFNHLQSFVTFFHPSSKYVGPGTEGYLDRDSVQISYPPQPEVEA